MPLFNLNDSVPNNVAQFGNALIRLDSIMSMEFDWNPLVNDTNSYAYVLTVSYNNTAQIKYTGNRKDLVRFLMKLDDIGYNDRMFVINDIDAFIESLHKRYHDLKTYRKITGSLDTDE